MRFLFNNPHGFSIVQGLILSAILAGSGLVATRLLEDQKLTQRHSETRDQIDQLHQIVYSALQSRQHCFRTMEFNGITSNLSSAYNDAISEIRTDTNNTIVRTNTGNFALDSSGHSDTYMNNNVRVTRMHLTFPHPDGDTGKALFAIRYERLNSSQDPTRLQRTGTGYGAKEIKKELTLRIQRGPTGTFIGCYATTDDNETLENGNTDLNKELCLSMNETGAPTATPSGLFRWDDARSLCTLNTQMNCEGLPGTVFTGIDLSLIHI